MFFPGPPTPGPTADPVTVLPVENKAPAGTMLASCAGAASPPEYRNIAYVVKVDNAGATPSSIQVIGKGMPAVTDPPGAGIVILGTAKARGADASKRAAEERRMLTCIRSAKRVNCARTPVRCAIVRWDVVGSLRS